MADVKLEKVSKVYPNVSTPAVNAVDIEIKDGEFMVLVGPSGCGKSTTLRMVAGLEASTSGDILIDGNRVNDVPPKDRDIAMIFQNYALYPHMSVYQNMAFPLKMRKFPRAQIDERVRDAAEMLSITPYLDRKPNALSGGQRQRVAVGRAIVRKPQVFLFDEPLSNLDAKMRVQMRSEIVKLHRRLETTIIYVTHDQVEAMTMGDRIVVMKDGNIQQIAEPQTIYKEPANVFVGGFIGSPPMNFLRGKLTDEGGKLSVDYEGTKLDVPTERAKGLEVVKGKEVILGIRPEHFSDSAPEVGGATLQAEVENVEPLGAETILYLKAGEASLVARVHPDVTPTIGDKRELWIDMTRVHFFDAKSEARIGC